MYELIKVGEQSYYIESPARIGVYVENGTEAYLIDSGNDKDACLLYTSPSPRD